MDLTIEILKRFDALNESMHHLGVAAWTEAVRYQLINGWLTIGAGLCEMLSILAIIYATKKFLQKWGEYDNKSVPMLLSSLVCMLVFLLGAIDIYQGILHVTCAKWFAIESLLSK